LLGNPYPSSLDWKADAGFNRSMLTLTAGGYDIWYWSVTANNYGVYNSADNDDQGTNQATRYIAPMQGFFVYTASAGLFGFRPEARVHTGASNWLRSAATVSTSSVRLKVMDLSGHGSDEIKLQFGHSDNRAGSLKLFSFVKEAPSLYLMKEDRAYSIRYLTDTKDNSTGAVRFKAGVDGTYQLTCQFDPASYRSVILEDRLTGTLHEFASMDSYTFSASVNDPANRFLLHFQGDGDEDPAKEALVYVQDDRLVIDLQALTATYQGQVYDVDGHQITFAELTGGQVTTVRLPKRGVYVVTLRNTQSKAHFKVVY
jgi:hypothetical protein